MDIIESVKKNKSIYFVYKHFMSIGVNVLKHFVKADDHLILFVSYGGRYYNDSPRCIYEEMIQDPRFSNYKLVWAFRHPEDMPVNRKIKIDTLQYYITALKARCWITNVIVERGLNFTGKKTYYFHTTHGTLPKYTGNDEVNKAVFGSTFRYKYDCSCAQSEVEKKLQLSMFGLKPEQVLVCGYPKNDRLAIASLDMQCRIKHKLGIEVDKKVILYAPTYRECTEKNGKLGIDFGKWQRKLGENYVILFRSHPVIAQKYDLSEYSNIIDVSSYPDNMELMIASDYMISDYSGIFFEYAILDRPMFCYAYDYDDYIKTRGLYMDLRKELPSGSEDEILEMIKDDDKKMIMEKVREFKEKYVVEYGHATKIAVENIYSHIRG